MATVTCVPNGNGSQGSWTYTGAASAWESIDEGTTTPNESDYVATLTAQTSCFYTLTDMPSDFGSAQSVTIRVHAACAGIKGNMTLDTCQIVKSDETTALTAVASLGVSSLVFVDVVVNPAITGSTDKASWDGAKIKFTTGTYTESGATAYIAATQVEVTYGAVHTVAISSPVLLTAQLEQTQVVIAAPEKIVDVSTLILNNVARDASVGSAFVNVAILSINSGVNSASPAPQKTLTIGPNGDYATIQSWFDAMNVASNSGVLTAYLLPNGTTPYAGAIFANPAFTLDSAHYFELRAHPSHKFFGTFNDTSPSFPIMGSLLLTNMDYTRIGELSFVVSGSTAELYAIKSTGHDVLVENCGIDVNLTNYTGAANAWGIIFTSSTDSTTVGTVRSCVFRNVSISGGSGTASQGQQACAIGAGGTNTGTVLNVYNCFINNVSASATTAITAAVGVNAIGSSQVSTSNVKLVRIYNTFILKPTATNAPKIYSGYFNGGTWTAGTAPTYDCGYNATSDTSLEQGSNNQVSVTLSTEIKSTTLASFDIHLRGTSTKLSRKGLNISAKPNAPSNDIDGAVWR